MRKIYLLLAMLIMLLLASCSAEGPDYSEAPADGLAFDYFNSYEIDGTNYDVYLPNDIKSGIYYKYEMGSISSNSVDWTINFRYEAVYHVEESRESKEVWTRLYEHLLVCESDLEEICGFDVMLFDPYNSMEYEYRLHNEEKEEATYVIFNTYLPIRLVNNKTRKTSTIGIPVNMDLLLKVGDNVEDPFTGSMISWEDFLAI